MPDNDFMNIQYAVLDTLTGDLLRSKGDAFRTMETLKTAFKQHLVDWDDQAQDLYTHAQVRWDASFLKLDGLLQQAVKHVDTTQAMYQHTERVNMSMWSA